MLACLSSCSGAEASWESRGDSNTHQEQESALECGKSSWTIRGSKGFNRIIHTETAEIVTQVGVTGGQRSEKFQGENGVLFDETFLQGYSS